MKMILAFISLLFLSGCCCPTNSEGVPVKNLYDIEVKTIAGETIKLEQFKGKTVLIVNTASKCGFTKQYEGLQNLYETYKDRDFVVLGFPANNFMNQEPGSNEEIQNFCKLNYGVTFPMFDKISVKGDDQHPLYAYLTSKETNPEHSGKISWNFNKFLITKDGTVVNRFGSRTKPSDQKLVDAIENELCE